MRFPGEEDDLIRHIKIAFDEIELERRRYRQIQANRARATKGQTISRTPAYGYDLSVDGKSYVENGERAHWVREIYRWYASGKSLHWIAKTMNTLGMKSPSGKDVWHTETIRGILRNEVYKGTYVSNRYDYAWVWEGGRQKHVVRRKPEEEWIRVPVPALVSAGLWEQANAIVARNRQFSARNTRKYHWLLSGLLRCVCGAGMSAKHRATDRRLASGITKRYWYEFYRCTSEAKTYQAAPCDRGLIEKNRLEQYVIQGLEALFMKPDLWEEALRDQAEDEDEDRWLERVKVDQAQLAEIDAQLGELLQMALEQRNPAARKLFADKGAELVGRRKVHEEDLAAAKDRVQVVRRAADKGAVVAQAIDRLKSIGGLAGLPPEMQREVVVQLVDEVILDTKEQWFEIRGAVRGAFAYGDERLETRFEGGCGRGPTARD